MAIVMIIFSLWLAELASGYPYFYVSSKKGRVCLKHKGAGESLELTVDQCCRYPTLTSEFHNNSVTRSDLCLGADNLANLVGGQKLKWKRKDANRCAKFQILANGMLQVSGLSGIFCLKEIDNNNPILRTCDTNSQYSFRNDGMCGRPKSQSYVVKEITDMKNGNYHLVINGNYLVMSQTTDTSKYAVLKLYSNKQMWAVEQSSDDDGNVIQGEKCVRIKNGNKAMLHQLGGLKLELKSSEQECKGQMFEYREDSKTYEVFGTNYCWKPEGNNLVLRSCTGLTNIFTVKEKVYNSSLSSSTVAPSSSKSLTHTLSKTTIAPSPSSVDKDMFQMSSATPAPSSYHQSVQESSLLNKKTSTSSLVVHATAHSTSDIPYVASIHQFSSTSSSLVKSAQFTSLFSSAVPTGMDSLIKSTASSTGPALTTSRPVDIVKAGHELRLAQPGQQCDDFCHSLGKFCSTSLNTGNLIGAFAEIASACSSNTTAKIWTEAYDPSYHIDTRQCAGYVFVNKTVECRVKSFRDTNIRRLCKCIKSADEDKFSPWVPWSDCSASCNGGTRTRSRDCNADLCMGDAIQTEECNKHLCPVDGGYSDWSPWSSCNAACGGGKYNRTRTCSNPYPQNGGLKCFGESVTVDICNMKYCPVNGRWSDWTDWSACDKPCNSGFYRRWRYCNNPAPLYDGNPCLGMAQEKRSCNTHACPAENITAVDVRFDLTWNTSMAMKGSAEFNMFYNKLQHNSKSVFDGSVVNTTYLFCSVQSLREGSVIATFTLYFTGLDSFQMLLLQDSIQDDKYLGKLKIIGSNSTFNTTIVPSMPPANFSLVPLSTTSIKASWDEVPQNQQNGNIEGYILFYKERQLRSEPYKSLATEHLNVTLLGLKVYTEYTFRLLAYNRKGNGIATKEKHITTQESVPSNPPQSIDAIANSPFTIIVEWTSLPQEQWNGQPVGTLIKYTDRKGQDGNKTVAFPKISIVLQNLLPVTTYVIDVCGLTAPGAGPCQRVQATTTPSPPTQAPENVTVDSFIGQRTLKVTWKHIALQYVHGDLKGYKVIYTLKKIAGRVIIQKVTKIKIVHPSIVEVLLTDLEPNSEYDVYVVAFNDHGDGKTSNSSIGETCTCPSVVYTNFAASAPYMYRDKGGIMKGLFVTILENATSYACGNCKRKKQTHLDFKHNGKNGWAEKRSLDKMKKDIDNYVHISFPVFGSTVLDMYYGYPFVAAITHPGVIYFIIKDTLTKQIQVLVFNVFNTWPIFLINILFITLSGFIIWSLESKDNPEEFPRSCWSGVTNGMYWAYVTMGTHGYGDLSPRGILSRLFSIAWILIAIVNLGIFTGALTTAITTAQVYSDPKIYNVEVAAIHDSLAYRIGIYRNGKMNEKAKYKTVEEVASALKRREVRGALVDVYSAATRSDLFKHPDIIAKKIIEYPSAYGFVLSGDMKNAAPTFRDYFKVHANDFLKIIGARTSGLVVNNESGETISMFDGESESLHTTLIIVGLVLIAAVLMGTLHYFCKNCRFRNCVDVESKTTIGEVYKACNESLVEFYQSASNNLDKMMESYMEERLERLMKNYKRNDIFVNVMKVQKTIKRHRKSVQIKTTEKESGSGNTEMQESDEAHIDVPLEGYAALPSTPTNIKITEM